MMMMLQRMVTLMRGARVDAVIVRVQPLWVAGAQ
jgi:hypothetical protein